MLMSYFGRLARTLARRHGFELVPLGRQSSDSLWPSWVDHLQARMPVQTVFDVGANRGQTVHWFRPMFPEAKIYSFEPAQEPYRTLLDLAAIDPLLVPVQLALGERSGEAELFENSSDTTNSLLQNSDAAGIYTPAHMCIPRGHTTVPLSRLDEFCEQSGIEQIDVLKLDVQGYERAVLDGAGAMLAPDRIRGIYLEMLFVSYYREQCWADELLALLRQRGYRLFGFCGVSFDAKQGWRWADAMFLPTEMVPTEAAQALRNDTARL